MKRVLLKLSGEALAGDKKTGFDEATCHVVAGQVKRLVEEGVQLARQVKQHNRPRARGSDRDAGDGDELHLCFRNFPL